MADGIYLPYELQASIRNQLSPAREGSAGTQTREDASLSLRGWDLMSQNRRSQLSLLLCPQANHVTSLDVSYSQLNWPSLAVCCQCLPNLLAISAVDCGLMSDLASTETPWPVGLRDLDLSRNRLKSVPLGLSQLMNLERLNVNGNAITEISTDILQLPLLRELRVVSNPVQNIPKAVCLDGVAAMRNHLSVRVLSPVLAENKLSSFKEDCGMLSESMSKLVIKPCRKLILHSDSTDSDYSSISCTASTTSSSTLLSSETTSSDTPSSTASSPIPETFSSLQCPLGYTRDCENSICQVFVPDSSSTNHVTATAVHDKSFHPLLSTGELLATPVVRVEPHGVSFPPDQPAMIALPCCIQSDQCYSHFTPMCSDTSSNESPQWENLPISNCRICEDYIIIETTHFSLFTVVYCLNSSSNEATITPNAGGTLQVERFPGFQLSIPPGSVLEPTTVKATVLNPEDVPHDDEHTSSASLCVSLEPHGALFIKPVTITIPIPDCQEIFKQFPNAELQLYHAPYSNPANPIGDWEVVDDPNIEFSNDKLRFRVNHFSFVKSLWNIPSETLRRIRCGAAYFYKSIHTTSISVRCQVFMTPPNVADLSFGLLVIVFKFGDSLRELGNYKWLLADTGEKRISMKTGKVCVNLQGLKFGCLSGLEGPELNKHQSVSFNGEDFCIRSEFALQLKEVSLPIPDWQLLGKLVITQCDDSQCIELNLLKPPLDHEQHIADQWPTVSSITPPQTPVHEHIHPLTNHKRRREIDLPTSKFSPLVKRTSVLKFGFIESDQELLNIARDIGHKWQMVGTRLGLPYSSLQATAAQHSSQDVSMLAFHMLQQWKQLSTHGCSYQQLSTALEEADMNRVAYQYCYTSETA